MHEVTASFTWLTIHAQIVDCELTWHPENPFAVLAIFTGAHQDPVEWMFSIDLLTDITEGRSNYSGHGDVTTLLEKSPTGDQIHLKLRSPFGEIKLITLLSVVKKFTDEVAEQSRLFGDSLALDVDLAIMRILQEEGGA